MTRTWVDLEIDKIHHGGCALDRFADRTTPLQFALFVWWWIGLALPLYHLVLKMIQPFVRRLAHD